MKRPLAVLLAGALLLAGMPAAAGGYGGNYGHGYSRYSYSHGYPGYRHGYGYRRGYSGHRGSSLSFHYSGHGDVLAGLAIGAVIGALVARPYYQPEPRYRPSPAYAQVQPRNCQPTTGTGYYNGRPAVFGGTYCRTAAGQGYIVAGSEHFLGYR